MLDCRDKQVEVGQQVAFSVGVKLLTGTVSKIQQKTDTYRNFIYDVATVVLDVPEPTRRLVWKKNESGIPVSRYEDKIQRTRTVYGSERIYVLKDAE